MKPRFQACSVCAVVDPRNRRHMNGWLCPEHAPAVPVPDPAATAEALRAGHLRSVRGVR